MIPATGITTPLAHVRAALLPETRAGRIAYARDTISDILFGDEQFTGEHEQPFDDATVVVFRVMVASEDDGQELRKDLAEALVTAGFDRVVCEPPVPMPGSDGFRCDVAVPVGAS